jgi:predicted short-subunit dehydrogenase-like oxidoreductase (DUF2520 family)
MSSNRASAPTLFIVGWGRVGSAIALQAKGWRVVGSWSRTAAGARLAKAAGLRGAVWGPKPPAIDADVALLTVPDAAVGAMAARLAQAPGSLRVVAHTSGSLDLAPLEPLRKRGIEVGSLHPFCSIVGPETALAGMTCAIDGSPAARKRLLALARALSLRPLSRPPRDRARYHLAASLLASSAGVLAGQGAELLRQAGLSEAEARAALAAILHSVAGNLGRLGATGVLTGPIVRGDAAVVGRHLKLLRDDLRTLEIYRALGRLALERAREEGRGDPAGQRAIARLLGKPRRG